MITYGYDASLRSLSQAFSFRLKNSYELEYFKDVIY